jgi:hypothetical protein
MTHEPFTKQLQLKGHFNTEHAEIAKLKFLCEPLRLGGLCV